LITDIHPPDVETRLAILRRNAELAPRTVPIEVLEFIATLVSDNIRELEGALTRVTAYAALTNGEIDLDMAQSVLQDLLPGHEAKALTAEEIIRATADVYSFTVEEVTGKSRRQPLVLCRQVAMYLCRDLTDLSLPKIGRQFGGRDHTTVNLSDLHTTRSRRRPPVERHPDRPHPLGRGIPRCHRIPYDLSTIHSAYYHSYHRSIDRRRKRRDIDLCESEPSGTTSPTSFPAPIAP
jgi:hypothetical protein